MTIELTTTTRPQYHSGMIASIQYISESTGTAFQLVNNTDDCTMLGAGTASGDNAVNLYYLGPGSYDGQIKWIGFGSGTAATGEAAILTGVATTATGATNLFRLATTGVPMPAAAATGYLVLSTASDHVMLRYADLRWTVEMMQGATWSTGT